MEWIGYGCIAAWVVWCALGAVCFVREYRRHDPDDEPWPQPRPARGAGQVFGAIVRDATALAADRPHVGVPEHLV